MSIITSGDLAKLSGPKTVVRDEDRGVELYTEFHCGDGGAPAYVVGKTKDGKADLVATGVRDQAELAALVESARKGELKPVDEKPIDEEPVEGGTKTK